jgi:hypothetical protein
MEFGMQTATYLITAMRDRPDRMASALWAWLQRHNKTSEQLAEFLGCAPATLERLAMAARPHPGDDWEVDVEIIAISLRLRHAALRLLLEEAEQPFEREFGG